MSNSLEYPYLVVSDSHFHDWDFGSYVTTDGINSRLQRTITAFKEAVAKLREAGGNHLVITGDLFHTRGEIKPSVYNPVYDMFKEFSESGLIVHAIPGNHDLETDETTEEGCCFNSFRGLSNFTIYYNPKLICLGPAKEFAYFYPWTNNFQEKLSQLNAVTKNAPSEKRTVFAHVGLSGVVSGIQHALNPAEFGKIRGIKNVFSGHFHNHKCFELVTATGDASVYSVGALTHQSFKDVDSVAGYIIAYSADKIVHYETSAPKFVDYDDDDYMSFDADKFQGNFVRMNAGTSLTTDELTAIKVTLESVGSLKVVNRMSADDSEDQGVMASPALYTYGPDGKGVSNLTDQFIKYVKSKYSKAMADKMIGIFEKDGIDET